MPPKKKGQQQHTTSEKNPSDEKKHVLLRDVTSKTLLIVRLDEIMSSSTVKVAVGKEVSYSGKNRARGRGTVLTIGE